MKKNLFLLFLFFMTSASFAQKQEKTTPFWGKQEVYLVNQTEKIFRLVDVLLKENMPSVGEPALARKSALLLLDGIFHDTRLDGSKVLSDFADVRLNSVLEDLKLPLTEGMKVYKLYNDGFIVRTKSATVAFDLYRGGKMKEGGHLISDGKMRAIAEQCDIMFLSHKHPYHVDPVVGKMFTDAGKEVVAPTDVLMGNGAVTHVRSEQIMDKKFKLKRSKLKVKILPGHQSEMMNNIHVVTTSEGFTFVQTGDQYNKEDLKWLLTVYKKIPEVDVLMINCWANRLSDTIDGFNPKLVLTGHENELGHTIDHRESYWASYVKLEDVRKPNCLMTWGECSWYKK